MTATAPSPSLARTGSLLPAVLGIGTAAPPAMAQSEIAEHAARLSRVPAEQQAWLTRVFRNSGIASRGIVLADPDDAARQAVLQFYPDPAGPDDRGPTTAQRMARYAAEAPALALSAAAAALAEARTAAGSITHLITVSCTGFFAPGLDAALIRAGLAPGVRRLHVGFMGCHGAFNAFGAARDAILADAGARVLVCCVELCSLHFAYGAEPGKLIANTLFADGAAAAVLGSDLAPELPPAGGGELWHVRDTASCMLPDSLDAMTWNIGDNGFEMTLSPGVPRLIRQHLRPWCESWLGRHELRLADIRGWAIHPGGPKILAAVAEALELPPEALDYSRKTLGAHGNMSSATILFILKQMAAGNASTPSVAIGLGPGLMAEGMLLE